MREKLIVLIMRSVNGCARHWAETIAHYLLANGVVVLPYKPAKAIKDEFSGEFICPYCGDSLSDMYSKRLPLIAFCQCGTYVDCSAAITKQEAERKRAERQLKGTNYKKVKNMNLDELANLIYSVSTEFCCCCAYKNRRCKTGEEHCEEGIKKWLRQKVEE